MPGTSIVQSGNYALLVDTGFNVNAFILDDYLKGLLDNTTYVLDGTDDYADITQSTTQIDIRRGRRDIGDQFATGTMTFTINDVDGVFNPFDDTQPVLQHTRSVTRPCTVT
jgi:hypothetical protein